MDDFIAFAREDSARSFSGINNVFACVCENRAAAAVASDRAVIILEINCLVGGFFCIQAAGEPIDFDWISSADKRLDIPKSASRLLGNREEIVSGKQTAKFLVCAADTLPANCGRATGEHLSGKYRDTI